VSNVSVGLGVNGLPQERRESFLHMLRNNLAALHRMLDDVTDLARLHAGQEQMRPARFDAAQTLTKLCNDLRPMADGKQLVLTVLGHGPLPVEGDEVKVRRIAQNLLLNAMKYTVAGGVVVDWGDTAARDDGRWWFSIVDTGPGFHAGPGAPLVRALGTTPGESPAASDARPVNQSHGEGLGLAIVKRLCELLGASLELDTAPDRGTTFRVFVPMRYPPASG
jgi:signal transduction histidine kinase